MSGLGNKLATARRIFRRVLTLRTDRIHALPVVVLMPHSRCNCRCVMCDIWKANERKQELSAEQLAPHVEAFGRLGVRSVVLSGGEPLLHSNLWTLCRLLDEQDIDITLLSTGLTLEQNAAEVARWCREVIVSIDGPARVHDRIRGIDGAFDRLARGVRAVRDADPDGRVTGRCVVQRLNYRHIPELIDAAREIPLDRISLLAADVSSTAFNRPQPWSGERAAEVALDAEQASELEAIIESIIVSSHDDFETGFIAESPDKLRRVAHHFQALRGARAAESPRCNAPWVSTVIEADGTVRPCFFHAPLGNIRNRALDDILNDEHAVAFRRRLDVGADPICRDCVCSLYLAPWQDGGSA
jgi:MoaA/NifB/PqqE/SkfB family radical SAM enzyme